MPSLNEISPARLMLQLGGPFSPVIVDVCTDEDFSLDPRVIPTTIRVPFLQVLTHLANLKGRRVVVVCQKGKKLSHGAAALLRSEGCAAEVLSGGIFAWRDAGLPLSSAEVLPNIQGQPSVWVTRHRPKIDRIASPWLIHRFIDPQARFLFVPPSDVLAVAERFNAAPFDVENTQFSHQGDRCTFDSLIEHFGLSHPALEALSAVVRAADTGRVDQSEQAAGLLAISVGFSRLYKNDQEQLNAALPIYDALYRWARDGQAETHEHDVGVTS